MHLNAFVKSIFRCKFVEKRIENVLPKVRVAADSKVCCPLAAFRPRQIPNLASPVAVPYDANLTVVILSTKTSGSDQQVSKALKDWGAPRA